MPPLPDPASLSALSGSALRLLLDLSLEGTILLAAGMLAVRWLRNATAATRHFLLAATFACLLALPVLEPLVPRWEAPIPGVVANLAARWTGPQVQPAETTADQTADPGIGPSRAAPPTVGPLVGKTRGRPAAASTASVLLASGWMTGLAVVLLYFGLGSYRLRGVSRRSHRLTQADWLEAASWARRRLHLDRPVRLLRSSEVEVPMTWGALRPAVVLPEDVKRWHAGLRRDVLLHELAHVKRRDSLVQGAVRLACALYWFHPLVWLAAAEIRQHRERACDDEVLHAGSPASEYAAHLLEIARSLSRGVRGAHASVAFARGRHFVARVSALLDADRRHATPSRRMAIGVFAVAGGVIVPLASMSPGTARPQAAVQAGECVSEHGQPRSVVRASFAAGDIVQTFFDDRSHLQLSESVGSGRPLVTAERGWCAIRFAGSTGGRAAGGSARLPLGFDPRHRLSLVEIEKRPPDRLPAPSLEAAGRQATTEKTKREDTT